MQKSFAERSIMKAFTTITTFLIFLSSAIWAQVETPLHFTSEDDNKVIKETDSGKYYAASGSSEMTVFINEDMKYRLFDKDNKLVMEGTISNDGDKYLKEGKWVEYYSSGKVKSTGSYHNNNPVGTWQKYYANGNPMSICSYTMIEGSNTFYCMSGTYEEFFENGQLKIKGLYKATIVDKSKDTVWIQDPETGKQVQRMVVVSKAKPEKFGTWEYYNEKGELVKNEEL